MFRVLALPPRVLQNFVTNASQLSSDAKRNKLNKSNVTVILICLPVTLSDDLLGARLRDITADVRLSFQFIHKHTDGHSKKHPSHASSSHHGDTKVNTRHVGCFWFGSHVANVTHVARRTRWNHVLCFVHRVWILVLLVFSGNETDERWPSLLAFGDCHCFAK
jgi:hypothetical protein